MTPVNQPPSSNPATEDVRNQHLVLDFAPSGSNESAVFTGVMPQHYDGGGVTVYLHYAMSSAVSGDIDWDVAFERIGDQGQDIDSDGFAAVNSVDSTTVPGASGLVDVVSVTFTDGALTDMAILSNGDRGVAQRRLMDRLSKDREPMGLNKPDLLAAVNDADQWVSDNAVGFDSALSVRARAALTRQQKAELLMFVVSRRFEVDA